MADLDTASAVFVPLQGGGAGCVHRWRIATPVGDLCAGCCSLCGAERIFTNERHPFGQPARTRRIPSPKRRAKASPGQGLLLRLLEADARKPETATG